MRRIGRPLDLGPETGNAGIPRHGSGSIESLVAVNGSASLQ